MQNVINMFTRKPMRLEVLNNFATPMTSWIQEKPEYDFDLEEEISHALYDFFENYYVLLQSKPRVLEGVHCVQDHAKRIMDIMERYHE